jgi:hypothetical protein
MYFQSIVLYHLIDIYAIINFVIRNSEIKFMGNLVWLKYNFNYISLMELYLLIWHLLLPQWNDF